MHLDMLKRDSIFWLFLILFFSCNNKKNELQDFNNRYVYIRKNFNKYSRIFMMAEDSLNKWVDDSLGVTTGIFYTKPHVLDSVFIFNNDSTRLYTTVNIRNYHFKNAIADMLQDFGGAKINGKWYFFFMGVSSPVRREDWQDSVYAPLTFEELSYVAYESHFKTLVKNIIEGKLEKNEEIFKKRLFFDISGIKNITDERRKQFEDSVILAITKEKYKYKLDPKEIADIKQSIAESKLPADKPLVKSYSWWEILQYGEKPFESDAWKNRNKRE